MGNRKKNLGFMKTNKSLSSFHCLFNTSHLTKRTRFLRWCIQMCHPQSSFSRPLMLCEQDTPALLFICVVPIQTDKNCFPPSQSIRGRSCNNTSSHKKGFRVVEVLLVSVNHSSPKSVRHPTEHITSCEGQGGMKAENVEMIYIIHMVAD